MVRISSIRWAYGALVVALLGGCSAPVDISISAGSPGGTFHDISAQLKGLLDRSDYTFIKSVTVLQSAGSVENVTKVASGEAFGMTGLLSYLEFRAQQNSDFVEPRAVTPLYDYYMHFLISNEVAQKCPFVEAMSDLPLCDLGREIVISVGKEGSGTWVKTQRLLSQVEGFTYTKDRSSATGASRRLGQPDNGVDAIFASMIVPDPRADRLLAAGGKLINVDFDAASMFGDSPSRTYNSAALGEYIKSSIPAHAYASKSTPTLTLRDPAVLLANEAVDDRIVEAMLRTIYDQARYLRDIHPATDEIWEFFDQNARNRFSNLMSFHPGADRFFDTLQDELLIVSGPVDGAHYQRAKELQRILARYRVASFVIPTKGTIANLEFLTKDRPVMAVAQHDTALASYLVDPVSVYKVTRPHQDLDLDQGAFGPEYIKRDSWGVPKVEFTRIANLFNEVIVPMVRTDGPFEAVCCTPKTSQPLRVSFGDPKSGTQVVTRAIMTRQRDQDSHITAEFFTGPEARRWLNSGQLDISFVVSSVNSELMNSLLATPDVKPVGLNEQLIRSMTPSAALHRVEITLPGFSEPLPTLQTTAVLLVNETVDASLVATIARAIHENRDQFVDDTNDIQRADLSMVSFTSPIPLHEEAENYYREVGLIPGPPKSWAAWIAQMAPIIAVGLSLITASALPSLRRIGIIRMERAVANVAFDSTGTVAELRKLQDQAKQAVNRRLRQSLRDRALPISTEGWRSLEALIDQRINSARHMLTRNLLREINNKKHDAGTDWHAMHNEIAYLFQSGELNMEQFEFLARAIGFETPKNNNH